MDWLCTFSFNSILLDRIQFSTCVMADIVMQKKEKYDSVKYDDVIVWNCIIFVKGWITLQCKTVVNRLI